MAPSKSGRWVGPVSVCLWLIGCALIIDCLCQGQLIAVKPSTGPSLPTASSDKESLPSPERLAFEKQMFDENKDHMDFLQQMDSRLEDDAIKLAGAALAIILGLAGWFGARTRKELEENIKAQADELAKQFATKTAAFERELDNQVGKLRAKFEEASDSWSKNATTEAQTKLDEKLRQLYDDLDSDSQDLVIVSESMALLTKIREAKKSKAVLDQDTRRAVESQMRKLTNDLERWPHNRFAAIQLAKFQKEFSSDAQKAIGTLENVLRHRQTAWAQAAGAIHRLRVSRDNAALLYNLACYKNLLAYQLEQLNKTNSGVSRLRAEAQSHISECLLIYPPDLEEATQDEDLRGLTLEIPTPNRP